MFWLSLRWRQKFNVLSCNGEEKHESQSTCGMIRNISVTFSGVSRLGRPLLVQVINIPPCDSAWVNAKPKRVWNVTIVRRDTNAKSSSTMMTKCAERYRPNDLTALITRLSTQKNKSSTTKLITISLFRVVEEVERFLNFAFCARFFPPRNWIMLNGAVRWY
jgi:hypothetical protein